MRPSLNRWATWIARCLLLTRDAQVGSAADGDAVLLAVAFFELHASALPGRRVERHHVAQVERRVLLDAPALRVALAGADVRPRAVDPVDDHAVLVRDHAEHAAGLTLVRARD